MQKQNIHDIHISANALAHPESKFFVSSEVPFNLFLNQRIYQLSVWFPHMVSCKMRSKTVVTWKFRDGLCTESVLLDNQMSCILIESIMWSAHTSDFLMICKLFHILEFSGFSSVDKPSQQFFLTLCFSYFSISLGSRLKSLSHSKVNETVQLGAEYGKYICHCTWWVLSSWAHTVLW